MIVLINNLTNEAYICRDKTQAAKILGVNRETVRRNFERQGDFWEKFGFKVYFSYNNMLKSRRGRKK